MQMDLASLMGEEFTHSGPVRIATPSSGPVSARGRLLLNFPDLEVQCPLNPIETQVLLLQPQVASDAIVT